LLLAVFVGGAAGGLARWGLSDWLGAGAHAGAWPWGTFVANVAGALLLGAVAASLMHHPDRRHLRAGDLLGPGLCGALTTFSTLQVEVVRLADDGHVGTAVGYLVATVAAGLAAVRIGEALSP
jgi:CrcB protein